jgi:hypothetical protein
MHWDMFVVAGVVDPSGREIAFNCRITHEEWERGMPEIPRRNCRSHWQLDDESYMIVDIDAVQLKQAKEMSSALLANWRTYMAKGR